MRSGASEEPAWTDTKTLVKSLDLASDAKKTHLILKAPASGERFFFSIDGSEKRLIEYGQSVPVPVNSTLELSGKHWKAALLVLKDGKSLALIVDKTVDERSMQGKLTSFRAAAHVENNGRLVDLDRASSETLRKEALKRSPEKEQAQ